VEQKEERERERKWPVTPGQLSRLKENNLPIKKEQGSQFMSFGRESRKEEENNNNKKRGFFPFFFESFLKKKKKNANGETEREEKDTHTITIFERYDTRISTASSKDTVRECVSRECGGKELDEREPLGYSLKTEIRKRKKIL
jgi:hypothetical protein